MPLYVALLRGINVGGHNKVAMSSLRDLLRDLGFSEAKSLLQSGNLLFESSRLTGAAMESLLETETSERLGLAAKYIVRSAAEWKKVIARNPFSREAKHDPGHLVAMFLKTAPAEIDLKALQDSIQGPEHIRGDGKQLYIVYPAGIGRSKLTGSLIEIKLRTSGTARNWNTILKINAFCK